GTGLWHHASRPSLGYEQYDVRPLRLRRITTALRPGHQTHGSLPPASTSPVLWRLPVGVRIEMLQDLLDRRELRDRWPLSSRCCGASSTCVTSSRTASSPEHQAAKASGSGP